MNTLVRVLYTRALCFSLDVCLSLSLSRSTSPYRVPPLGYRSFQPSRETRPTTPRRHSSLSYYNKKFPRERGARVYKYTWRPRST